MFSGVNQSVPTIVDVRSDKQNFGSQGVMTNTDLVELNLSYNCSIGRIYLTISRKLKHVKPNIR